jgi:hypothetical protein
MFIAFAFLATAALVVLLTRGRLKPGANQSTSIALG